MAIPKARQLTRDQLGFSRPCPLWFYVLKEAEVLQEGTQLGPVGGGIVAETFLGLLAGDKASYLSVEPSWRPTLASTDPRSFPMTDLIRFAVPDQASRSEASAPVPTQ